MAHLLVNQLHFARSELVRCLEGVSDDDGMRKVGPMNCISWIVGHLANHEDFVWGKLGQGKALKEGLYQQVGYGQPASTPSLDEMWDTWKEVTASADVYLVTLNSKILNTHFEKNGKPYAESIGTMLLRNVYHYWFHIGEAHAIRQHLGHENLPDFVGNMANATYQPESDV
jgi:hypothetical protein